MSTQTSRPLALEGCNGHSYAQRDPLGVALAEQLNTHGTAKTLREVPGIAGC